MAAVGGSVYRKSLNYRCLSLKVTTHRRYKRCAQVKPLKRYNDKAFIRKRFCRKIQKQVKNFLKQIKRDGRYSRPFSCLIHGVPFGTSFPGLFRRFHLAMPFREPLKCGRAWRADQPICQSRCKWRRLSYACLPLNG